VVPEAEPAEGRLPARGTGQAAGTTAEEDGTGRGAADTGVTRVRHRPD